MNIPDIIAKGSHSLFFATYQLQRQDNDDEETQKGLFDMTLDLTISLDDQIVDKVPNYMSGTIEGLAAAKAGKGSKVVRFEPLGDWRKVHLSMARGDSWTAFEDVGAEVRVVQVVCLKKNPLYKAKIKVTGLDSGQVGMALECWKRSVEVSIEPVQLQIAEAA
jgi:hypothetical protein